MSNQSDHTIVRLRVPPELKKQIEESAEANNRSQSAEMVARLEQSFKTPELGNMNGQQLHDFLQDMIDESVKKFTYRMTTGDGNTLLGGTIRNKLKTEPSKD